jgi:methionyl-tRNA formyltransferase
MFSKRLLFLGSDQISQICLNGMLEDLKEFNFEVITTSENSPPGVLAKTKGIKCYVESKGSMKEWKILAEDSEIWKERFDFLVSASFGYLIPRNLIEFCDRSLNFHPSLLPKYRGSSPIQYALYNNDERTGISVITIDPDKFDKGMILKRVEHPDSIQNETYASLSVKLATLGSIHLPEIIKNYSQYLLKAEDQDDSKSSNAFKLPSSFYKLGIEDHSEIFNRFRGTYGTSQNPYYIFDKDRVVIKGMRKASQEELEYLKSHYPSAVPGSIWLIYPGIGKQKSKKFYKSLDKVIYMKTKDSWLVITDFLKAGYNKEKWFTDFLENYFDLQAYVMGKNFSTSTGDDLKFE